MNRDAIIQKLLEMYEQKQIVNLRNYRKKLASANTCNVEQEYSIIMGIKTPVKQKNDISKIKKKKRHLKKSENRSTNNIGDINEKRTDDLDVS